MDTFSKLPLADQIDFYTDMELLYSQAGETAEAAGCRALIRDLVTRQKAFEFNVDVNGFALV